MSKKHPTTESFSYAFDGIRLALKNEPNFKVHIIIASLVMILATILKLDALEFTVLILTIGIVLILELINTTLETLVDLVSPDVKAKAKIAKDVSAAAVLVSATMSIAIGTLLFLPKILALFYK